MRSPRANSSAGQCFDLERVYLSTANAMAIEIERLARAAQRQGHKDERS
jgi:hypothetical protein